jgi:rRNA maturation RNase YbeY
MVKNLSVHNSTSFKINKSEIHAFVNSLKKELNFELESVAINFLSSGEIQPINDKYLGHNYSTDILTITYSGENYTLDGEIFISLDDALFFAKKYGVELKDEVVRLVIHGFLHLIGYDDQNSDQKRKMKSKEDRLVDKYLNSLTKII